MTATLLDLTDEQQALIEVCHDFAERELRPVARDYDDDHDHPDPTPLLHRAAELGLPSFSLPAEYGGGGIEDVFTACLVSEELSWGDDALASLLCSGGFFAHTVLALGSEQQKQRWVPPLCGPRPVFAALATTEPGAGSDAASITTHARRVEGGYVLNGQKTWISNAPIAEYFIVFATVAPGTRSRGVTAFVVERGADGFAVGPPMAKLGQRCDPDRRAVPARLLRRRRPANRRGGPGLLRPDGDVRCVADHARGERRRRRPRRRRVRHRLRQGAAGVRQADRRLPGGLVPARRRRHEGRPGAADHAPRRPPVRRRPPRRQGGRDGEAGRVRGGVVRGRRVRARRSAATATRPSTPRRSGSATPSSTSSGRARATSCA